MSTNRTLRPIVTDDFSEIDCLEMVPYVMVPGHKLKEGMILVDDLDTPVIGLDTKCRGGNGCVIFMFHDLVEGGFTPQQSLTRNKSYKVMAA